MIPDFLKSEEQINAEKILERFVSEVKKQITDTNNKYREITDINGKNPLPLHETLILKSFPPRYWFEFDNMYELDNNTKEKISKIYKSVFLDK